MIQTCRDCLVKFDITADDLAFYDRISPVFHGKKYAVLPPTQCPACRQRQRLTFRNEHSLHYRTCDATGETILSAFSPSANVVVYQNDAWYSDSWDGRDFGREFDFSKSFFDQFAELLTVVPQLALSAVGNHNSHYVNQCGWSKNCYLTFEADGNENCMYSNHIYDSRFCVDCHYVTKCELCYECIDCTNCYDLKFSQNCHNSSASYFLKNCIGCTNCFGCVNLRNKQYYFYNQKCTKEEYFQKLTAVGIDQYSTLQKARKHFQNFSQQFPHKAVQGIKNEDSSGEHLSNTQNTHGCFDVHNAKDCKHVFDARNVKNVHDMTAFGAKKGAEFCYQVHEVGDGVRNVFFSDQIWEGCHDIWYSKLCVKNSHDLFGCIGLKQSEYCILNKQYTKEEYETLVPKIIEHMAKISKIPLDPPFLKGEVPLFLKEGLGEISHQEISEQEYSEWGSFFPSSLSPFQYGETMAQEYFPISENSVETKDLLSPQPQNTNKTIPSQRLPKRIADIPDDILNWAIVPSSTDEAVPRPYRIQKSELKFYRDAHLPIPRLHPHTRAQKRQSMRNPRTLFERNCMKCSQEIQTTYAPERREVVVCEECYAQELL